MLTQTQRAVLKGMAGGASIAVAVVLYGVLVNPWSHPEDLVVDRRLQVAVRASMAPALLLAIAIVRLARHRFFSEADIEGGSPARGTGRALFLQAMVQNTLEQALLACIAYTAWAMVMPPAWLSVVTLAALSFVLGRVLFFMHYRRGAGARALGFTVTFYPTTVMLALCALWAIAAP
ncbi:MAG: MAPEG family protein [Pseudoxanthomonas sp.]